MSRRPDERCDGCKFFDEWISKNDAGGYCRLHPVKQDTLPSDWCGQWRSKYEPTKSLTRQHVLARIGLDGDD